MQVALSSVKLSRAQASLPSLGSLSPCGLEPALSSRSSAVLLFQQLYLSRYRAGEHWGKRCQASPDDNSHLVLDRMLVPLAAAHGSGDKFNAQRHIADLLSSLLSATTCQNCTVLASKALDLNNSSDPLGHQHLDQALDSSSFNLECDCSWSVLGCRSRNC